MKKVFASSILILSLGIVSIFFAANRPAEILFRKSEQEPQIYSDEEIKLFYSEVRVVDPKEDARKRYRLFDRRFVGVMANTMRFPGLEETDWRRIKAQGYKEILGGTDFIQTEEQSDHNIAIWSYAQEYNRELLRILDGHQ